MQANFQIRPATFADRDLVTELSTTTFIDSFGEQNTEADMFLYLSANFSKEKLGKELADEENKFFLSFLDEQAVGYLKLRANNIPAKNGLEPGLEIERIYVKKEFHDKKIGAALMAHAFDFAQSNHYKVIWLGVWEKNFKAISFYKKWGFEIFGDHIFMLGNDPQRDLLMMKSVDSGQWTFDSGQ